MKRLLQSAVAVSVMLVVSAGGTLPVGASANTPFRAQFEVPMTLTPDADCGGFRVTGTGTGRATHMGAATITVDECVNFVREPGRVHVYGMLVLTAANGDELHVSVDKVGDLPGPTGDAHVKGPYEVTGGTGRFAAATGSGITSTDANVITSTATARLIGTLRWR